MVVMVQLMFPKEEDLNLLRERWSEALSRRQTYLDNQIQALINKQGMEVDCILVVKK